MHPSNVTLIEYRRARIYVSVSPIDETVRRLGMLSILRTLALRLRWQLLREFGSVQLRAGPRVPIAVVDGWSGVQGLDGPFEEESDPIAEAAIVSIDAGRRLHSDLPLTELPFLPELNADLEFGKGLRARILRGGGAELGRIEPGMQLLELRTPEGGGHVSAERVPAHVFVGSNRDVHVSGLSGFANDLIPHRLRHRMRHEGFGYFDQIRRRGRARVQFGSGSVLE